MRFRSEIRFDLKAGYFRVLHEAAPEIADSLAGSKQSGGFRGYAGSSGFLRQCWGPGWALVGDAAYFKDPITAHGITDALRDAELLARAVVAGTTNALADYQRIRDELSLRLFHITDVVASLDRDMDNLKELHKDMSDEMRKEVNYLSALEDDGSSTTHSGRNGVLADSRAHR